MQNASDFVRDVENDVEAIADYIPVMLVLLITMINLAGVRVQQ